MTDRPIEHYVARLPRHDGTRSSRLWIEADLDGSGVDCPFEATLINLSRKGMQAILAIDFASGHPVTIRITSAEHDLNLTAAAEVRWKHEEADGSWSIGFEFLEPFEWEMIGELFLRDLLSRE